MITPRPWKVIRKTQIYADKDEQVASVSGETSAIAAANARHIVTACNNFDALVEALEDYLRADFITHKEWRQQYVKFENLLAKIKSEMGDDDA